MAAARINPFPLFKFGPADSLVMLLATEPCIERAADRSVTCGPIGSTGGSRDEYPLRQFPFHEGNELILLLAPELVTLNPHKYLFVQ